MIDTERNDPINIFDYVEVLRRRRTAIILIVAVSVLSAGIMSFLMTPVYESTAVIMPASPQKEPGGMSALTAQLGLTAPPTSNVSEMLALLRSNILTERVIGKYNLIPVFFPKDFEKMSAAEKTWNGIEYFREIFRVRYNQKDGVVELSVEYRDPEVAASILRYVLTELTEYMSGEARRVAETNRQYLESLIEKNADPLIRQKIYSMVAQQIETSMMAEVKENFAFKIIDPPKAPKDRIRPARRKNVMMAFVISLFAAVFTAFIMEYFENAKKRRG